MLFHFVYEQMNKNFYNHIFLFNLDKIDKILSYIELNDKVAQVYYVNINIFNYYYIDS
jgi:hypothetical protein